MTANAPGGPPSSVETPLRRVSGGLYVLSQGNDLSTGHAMQCFLFAATFEWAARCVPYSGTGFALATQLPHLSAMTAVAPQRAVRARRRVCAAGIVKSKIASYKAPRSVRFVDSLPRTETGKLLKSELKAADTTAS
jgi:hypothetical protein